MSTFGRLSGKEVLEPARAHGPQPGPLGRVWIWRGFGARGPWHFRHADSDTAGGVIGFLGFLGVFFLIH